MSYIPGLFQAPTTEGTQSPSVADNPAIMGKQDFLTLLVAQLQNQDPLNPDDPTEFTAQLAQFSSLEQLFNLNEGMDELAAAQSGSDNMAALSLIGKDVTYFGSKFNYSGEPVTLGYQLDGQAARVTLTIQAAGGAVVKTIDSRELTAGNHYLSWDGKDMDGNAVAPGDYHLTIQAAAAIDGSTVAAAPLIRSSVTGVDLDETEGNTLLTQMGKVALNDIIGVFDTNISQQGYSQDGTTSNQSTSSVIEDAADTAQTVAEAVDTVTGTSSAPTDEEQPASVN
ncbi:MAG: flagellar hook capping FlgD N-terminal domain-containing protein [Thermodesulfobacteriota bacterium]